MNVWRLVVREIAHRRGNFSLGLLSVSVAVACLVGAITLLDAHELRTGEILALKEQELQRSIADKQEAVEQAGRELQDSMRKITKGLGFNILVLPQDQVLNELHTEGSLSATMQQEYVDRLANSKIVTINHLLPMVMQKIHWQEMDQQIILIGTRGEVPLMHRDFKKPLQDPVAPGEIVVGYQVHTTNNLSIGDRVTLLGRQFTVSKLHPERGSADDSTVWINLGEAQELLDMQNLLNAILALECNCEAPDRIGQIRQEIAGILPGTQVIERGRPALARAEARNRAKQQAEEALIREKRAAADTLQTEQQGRDALGRQRQAFAAVLVPLVIGACGLWIGVLAYGNVRQRSAEIGILRAIGFGSAHILLIFLGKALIIGLLGAAVGYVAGFAVGLAWSDLPSSAATSTKLFAPELLLLSFVIALLLSALASWIPAVLAARQDPALVLQQE